MKQSQLKAVPPRGTTYQPKSILDPAFKYIPAAATDVQLTWIKFGWKPPERKKNESNS